MIIRERTGSILSGAIAHGAVDVAARLQPSCLDVDTALKLLGSQP